MSAIAQNVAALRERIEAAALRAGRRAADVTLLGVAKKQSVDAVVAAVAAGVREIGENFAQEAREKIPRVRELLAARGLPEPRWHFLGQLQRNKARLVAPLFDCVQTVDRIDLAQELSRRAAAAGHTLEVLLQVNVDAEPQKGGAEPSELETLLAATRALPALAVRGLMAIPEPRADMRPAFARLRSLRDDLERTSGAALPVLSMGMSDDFEAAIAEGATCVRIGTALFGARGAAT
ncbi:MAG TPA: YggS family pyridoxal phosphate-dependent enzyme [Myxococcota bacterium]|nr:YggS family pyridoxal phosphate-dependent enzyme [Myxococcota bacterium]